MKRNPKARFSIFLGIFLFNTQATFWPGQRLRLSFRLQRGERPRTMNSSRGLQLGPKARSDCHQKEYELWSTTPHSKMLRKVSPDMVVADFNNVELTYTDVEVLDAGKSKVKIAPTIKLKHAGEDYLITLVDKDNEANNQTYPMAYVLGGKWEQQFEVQVGSTVFPSPMRWVVADGQWRTKAFSEIWWMADGTPDGRRRKPEEMQGNQN